jgi:hypothetical protein
MNNEFDVVEGMDEAQAVFDKWTMEIVHRQFSNFDHPCGMVIVEMLRLLRRNPCLSSRSAAHAARHVLDAKAWGEPKPLPVAERQEELKARFATWEDEEFESTLAKLRDAKLFD